ncbi:uncharacterized protein LOC126967498 [Leptidea sinapis]|uniref:uncharacterized protein LOC126967498 n=1 Tax=Leptidea sinapis TaxID=189913 RepID=UPI0021C33F93|nr:uncharacterized protein LOC126967498 [Leptidea sinapis]
MDMSTAYHDSGGPAVRDGVLLGIVSFGGKQCGDPQSPGVYSRVPQITPWVELTVTNNEASDVPELQAKIKKARQREKELQKFKARVEEKKNKIKSWLRETLQSPTFIELAKKKLLNSGFDIRKKFRRTDIEPEDIVDDKTMDDINLSNLINDVILESDVSNDGEVLLTTLAMHELVLLEGQSSDDDDDAISTLIALINK